MLWSWASFSRQWEASRHLWGGEEFYALQGLASPCLAWLGVPGGFEDQDFCLGLILSYLGTAELQRDSLAVYCIY